MVKNTANRTKYWWLWPDFYDEEDARDAAKMGVIACGLIAAVTGLIFVYRYYKGGDIYQLIGGVMIFIVYSVLGYGIFRMSRVACATALALFVAEKIYSSAFQGKSLGIAIILVWYLIQASRAVFWFRRKR